MRPTMWFLPSGTNNLLITGFEPQQAVNQCVVIVPPFAEEMNKSRKMCSDFARHIASDVSSTTAVYMIDLFGCGDSEGALIDATWSIWHDNITDLLVDLAQKHPDTKFTLLGVRLGALLALDYCVKNHSPSKPSLILWQPALNGAQFITQFFRLKIATAMTEESNVTMAQIRQQLVQDSAIEIGGYHLSLDLVTAIEELTLHKLVESPPVPAFAWLEVGQPPKEQLLPVSQRIVDKWNRQSPIVSEFCRGNSFWQTSEITTAPSLIELTQRLLWGNV